MKPHFDRLDDVFAEALAIADAAERRMFLDGTCSNDKAVRREVDSPLCATACRIVSAVRRSDVGRPQR